MRAKNKGMVLLMVLAVLTLLCLLGLMFVMMANMERATARAYLDMVRTKMIAQSGIHAAMVNTRALLTEKGFDIEEMEYHGEDLNSDSVITVGLESYENQDNDDKLQTLDCPLYRAVRPSFMVDLNQDGNLDQNDLVNIQSKWVGLSGIMPGPYNQTLGAYYTVKVEDLSGRLCLNMLGDSAHGGAHDNGLVILQNLCTEIFDSESKGKQIGSKIYSQLPYITLEEMMYETGLTQEEYDQVKSYLTTYAYYDRAVIKPVPPDAFCRVGDIPRPFPRFGESLFSWRQFRPKRIQYPEILSYDGKKTRVGRAPVNINTAPKPVLVALLQGLGGIFLNESVGFKAQTSSSQFPGIWYSYYKYDSVVARQGLLGRLDFTPEITRAMSRQIARAIIQNRQLAPDVNYPWRGQFRGWQQFNAFCDNVLWRGNDPQLSPLISLPLTPQQADVLKANFNPNSNISAFNPPTQRLFWVDKTNLWRVARDKFGGYKTAGCYTTEFSFFPSGYFEITALGRLLGHEQKVLSEAEITALVRLFALYKETSQQDFLEDFWKNNESIYDVIERNDDGLQTTHDELTLQSYPEILEYDNYAGSHHCRGPLAGTGPGTGNPYVQDAHYDGYIALATVENRATDDPGADPDFRASYPRDNLEADTGQALIRDQKGPYVNRLVAAPDSSTDQVTAFKNAPGTLFPDGVYSELDAVPIYDYQPPDFDNFTVSMWLKPHFFPESSAKTRVYLTYQVWENVAHNYGPTAVLGIYNIANNSEDCSASGYGGQNYMPWDHTAFMAGGYHMPATNVDGSGQGTPCLNHINCGNAQGYHAGYTRQGGEDWGMTLFRAGKWMHLVWAHRLGENIICVNRKECIGTFFRCEGVASKQSKPVFSGPLRLGERSDTEGLNSVPDATLDEVLIWENASDAAYIATRDGTWQPGRYYRGNAGTFTSRSINLTQAMVIPTGTPITVFMVNWTQYAPEEKWTANGQRLNLPVSGQAGAPTCEVEIVDAKSVERIGVRKSDPTKPPDPSGELIKDTYTGKELVVTEPIRYRVKFLPNVNPLNDVLVDPLIFDDITIIYYSVPKFLSWAYRR